MMGQRSSGVIEGMHSRDEIAALRRELRRVGRRWSAETGLHAAVVAVPLAIAATMLEEAKIWPFGVALFACLCVGVPGALLVLLPKYRRERRDAVARLRNRLQALAAAERASVLRPFGAGLRDLDANTLADELREELRRPGEVSAAAPSDGRGDEVTGTG